MTTPIDPPTLALSIDDLVDWLELTALFDPFGVARIDALLGSLSELEETAEDNISKHDQNREQLIERLENEVEVRRNLLGETYPFELTASGEELFCDSNWRDLRFTFYLRLLLGSGVVDLSSRSVGHLV